MLTKFIIRLTGWYSLRTTEKDFPVLLNRLNEADVPFWGARIKDGYGYVRIALFDYAAAKNVSGGIAEDDRHIGLPFIIYKYRNRIGLIVGSIVGLLLMFLSSLFVWDVRVTGNGDIPETTILKALSECGVRIGAFIPDIYAPEAGTRLLLSLPQLSSAFVNIDGTILTVDVIPRREKPEIEDFGGTFDVAASEDGVIVGVEAYSGKPLVSHGDVVTKGQLLISGNYLYGAETEIESNARGKVFAETKKTFVCTIPLSYPYREYTGRTDIKTSYNILGKNFDMFYGQPSDYELFEAEIRSEKAGLFFLSLPVTKHILTLREYRVSYAEITQEDAKRKAERAFDAWCAGEIDGEIVSKDAEFVFDSGAKAVTIVGRVNVICDIAESVPRTDS